MKVIVETGLLKGNTFLKSEVENITSHSCFSFVSNESNSITGTINTVNEENSFLNTSFIIVDSGLLKGKAFKKSESDNISGIIITVSDKDKVTNSGLLSGIEFLSTDIKDSDFHLACLGNNSFTKGFSLGFKS